MLDFLMQVFYGFGIGLGFALGNHVINEIVKKAQL